MGLKVNFRGDSNKSKAPLAKGEWEAVFKKFDVGYTSNDTPYIKGVFVVTDENAVDTDGNSYTKRWVSTEPFWVTDSAMWRFKEFASEMGVDLPDEDEVEYEDLSEFAESMEELFMDSEVTVATDLTDSADGTRQFAGITAIL